MHCIISFQTQLIIAISVFTKHRNVRENPFFNTICANEITLLCNGQSGRRKNAQEIARSLRSHNEHHSQSNSNVQLEFHLGADFVIEEGKRMSIFVQRRTKCFFERAREPASKSDKTELKIKHTFVIWCRFQLQHSQPVEFSNE